MKAYHDVARAFDASVGLARRIDVPYLDYNMCLQKDPPSLARFLRRYAIRLRRLLAPKKGTTKE